MAHNSFTLHVNVQSQLLNDMPADRQKIILRHLHRAIQNVDRLYLPG